MRALAAARSSRAETLATLSEKLMGLSGWQEYGRIRQACQSQDRASDRPSHCTSAFWVNGFTAYFGPSMSARQAGDTLSFRPLARTMVGQEKGAATVA